jgi:hypothetical protein
LNEFPTWTRGALRATALLIVLISLMWSPPSLAQTALPATQARANPKLLTLPFNDPSVHISQGWLCHWSADECAKLYGSLIHGGIDYVKGTWPGSSFEVVAAADGPAYYRPNHSPLGNAVIVEHQVNGKALYTLYGHLQSSDLPPEPAWTYVQRGQKIGLAGDSGSAKGRGIHLHFALCVGDWRTKCKAPYPDWTVDPYDIYGTWGSYPPDGALGVNHFFATDPPQLPFSRAIHTPRSNSSLNLAMH